MTTKCLVCETPLSEGPVTYVHCTRCSELLIYLADDHPARQRLILEVAAKVLVKELFDNALNRRSKSLAQALSFCAQFLRGAKTSDDWIDNA